MRVDEDLEDSAWILSKPPFHRAIELERGTVNALAPMQSRKVETMSWRRRGELGNAARRLTGDLLLVEAPRPGSRLGRCQ